VKRYKTREAIRRPTTAITTIAQIGNWWFSALERLDDEGVEVVVD
jgi:hypothetical protein